MSHAKVDVASSTITLRTRAQGLLARLAHDLEIAASSFTAELDRDAQLWKATLRFVVAELNVVGVVKRGRVDRSVLSAKDRGDIERKLREEVLTGPDVVVRAAGVDQRFADIEVVTSTGTQRLRAPLHTEERPDGGMEVIGKLTLSLRALNIREVKAPLGAFKVADAIEVAFVVVLPVAEPA